MDAIAKLQCPQCRSRLDVFETPSGARIVAVAFLGPTVEDSPVALEQFHGPDFGRNIACPACRFTFDPAEPRRIPPLKRPPSDRA
jgi:hypothetical protein